MSKTVELKSAAKRYGIHTAVMTVAALGVMTSASRAAAAADDGPCGPPTVCTPQASMPPTVAAVPESPWRARLPFELGGTTMLSHGGVAGFTASFLPGVGWKGFDMNALLSAIGRNPRADKLHGDFGVGGRLSLAVGSFLEGAASVRIAAEGEYLVAAKNARAAVGVIFDVSSLLRIGLWLGRDQDADAQFINLTIGSDFLTWSDPVGSLLRPGPMEDFGNGSH